MRAIAAALAVLLVPRPVLADDDAGVDDDDEAAAPAATPPAAPEPEPPPIALRGFACGHRVYGDVALAGGLGLGHYATGWSVRESVGYQYNACGADGRVQRAYRVGAYTDSAKLAVRDASATDAVNAYGGELELDLAAPYHTRIGPRLAAAWADGPNSLNLVAGVRVRTELLSFGFDVTRISGGAADASTLATFSIGLGQETNRPLYIALIVIPFVILAGLAAAAE